jgi:hypothetical protein
MRPSRVIATVVVALALVTLTAACDGVGIADINTTRETAGKLDLPSSLVLDSVTKKHAQAMCKARKILHAPATAYHQETAVAVHELVGAARLEPSIRNADLRTIAAR